MSQRASAPLKDKVAILAAIVALAILSGPWEN